MAGSTAVALQVKACGTAAAGGQGAGIAVLGAAASESHCHVARTQGAGQSPAASLAGRRALCTNIRDRVQVKADSASVAETIGEVGALIGVAEAA